MLEQVVAQWRRAAHYAAVLSFAKATSLAGEPAPIYLDVGARDGLRRGWWLAWQMGLVMPAFCEPEPAEAARLAAAYPGCVIIRHALGAVVERRPLYVTHEPGRSSLLRPDPPPVVRSDREGWRTERVMEVDVLPLTDAWPSSATPPPTFIKIDVQGFEREVLAGAGELLDEVLAVELETSLVPFYQGQPLFQDLFRFMHERGFDLVKIRPLALFDGALLEFNAFFVRRGQHENGRVRLWKLVNDVGSSERVAAYGF